MHGLLSSRRQELLLDRKTSTLPQMAVFQAGPSGSLRCSRQSRTNIADATGHTGTRNGQVFLDIIPPSGEGYFVTYAFIRAGTV